MVQWISMALSVVALSVAAYTWFRTYKKHQYDIADTMLNELVKISLQYPDFRDDEYCRKAPTHEDRNKRLAYDAYATLVWNYLETLYDTYGKNLRTTSFYGALRTLGHRHQVWLLDGNRFKDYRSDLLTFLEVEK